MCSKRVERATRPFRSASRRPEECLHKNYAAAMSVDKGWIDEPYVIYRIRKEGIEQIREGVGAGRLFHTYNSNFISVTAPSEALVTALAYLASTPRV